MKNKIKILIVEDEGVTALDLQNGLEEQGFFVSGVVASGKEAITKIKEQKPDLVLMDIIIEGEIDGIETADKINAMFDIPVIYLTAFADKDILERAKITGPFGYMVKPIDHDDLSTAIEMALYKHKTEMALRAAKEQAEKATKMKDKFVSLVSHDLRSPLASIQGFAKLILSDEKYPLPPPQKELVQRIQDSGERILSMIEELLQISRLQTGNIELKPLFIEGRSAVMIALGHLYYQAKEKGIELINDVPEGTRLYADPTLLDQVLLNLASNAVKFCQEGDRVIFFIPYDKKTTIAIKDSGVGMSDTILENVFKHEVKTSTNGTKGERGTGLGLPLSFDIMKAHGGTLLVESVVGQGSVFYAMLPDVKPIILIVDDDRDTRLLIKKILGKINVDFIEAENGKKALSIIDEKAPHLVLIDLKMPEMDGFELLEKIQANPKTKTIPRIVITSNESIQTKEMVLHMGARDFVAKPIQAKELLPKVKRFVI